MTLHDWPLAALARSLDLIDRALVLQPTPAPSQAVSPRPGLEVRQRPRPLRTREDVELALQDLHHRIRQLLELSYRGEDSLLRDYPGLIEGAHHGLAHLALRLGLLDPDAVDPEICSCPYGEPLSCPTHGAEQRAAAREE